MKNKIILFLLFLVSFANASESIDATFKKANDLKQTIYITKVITNKRFNLSKAL